MPENVNQKVQTTFAVQGAGQAQGAFDTIGKAASGLGGVLSRVMGVFSPLNAALGTIASGAAMAGIASIGSDFENMRNSMAQTLRFMGEGGNNYSEALENADMTINQVFAAAAALPGEAEDYANAMALAGASVQRATGDYQTSFDLIRDMTAVGISMGASAEETASQMNRMLNSSTGMMETQGALSMNILNAMRQLPGQAALTAVAFNHMNLEERTDLLTRTVGQFRDMVDASKTSWDAVAGGAMTTFKTVVRLATGPFFDAMKDALGGMNSEMVDSDGNLTDMGQKIVEVGRNVATVLGAALKGAVALIKAMATGFERFSTAVQSSRAFAIIRETFEGLQLPSVPGGGGGGPGGGGADVAPLAALGAVFGVMLTHGEALVAMFAGLAPVGYALLEAIGPTVSMLGSMAQTLWEVTGAVLPGLIEGLSMIIVPLIEFSSGMMTIVSAIYERLRPTFVTLGEKVGNLARAIGSVLGPVIRIVGNAFTWLYQKLSGYLIPVVETVGNVLGVVIDVITEVISALGRFISSLTEEAVKTGGGGSETSTAATAAAAAAAAERATRQRNRTDRATAAAARPTPAGRGGGRTVQDFRHSRFDIKQQFDERFDPDRVAVAFANDLGRLGEQRLQSGFEPAFSIR